MTIIFVLAVVLAVVFFFQAFQLIRLKNRCTVKVTARCIGIETKEVDFSRRIAHSQNATYSFDLNGRSCIGKNSVWTSSGFSGIYVKTNDVVDIFIDPNDPEHGIFDPFAKRELRKYIFTGIVILLALLPFAFIKMMVHSMLFNHSII